MMKNSVLAKWILVFMLSLAASSPVAAAVIDTDTAWDGSMFVSSFGVPNTQTYGQVVTAPAAVLSLTSFSFRIQDQGNVITFLGEVYAWDDVNNRATGSALYESASVSTAGSNSYQQFTFTIPGGVAVTPGQKYVLFATTSKSVQNAGVAGWAARPDTAYAGGKFVFMNNGTDTALWTSSTWSYWGANLAFIANFQDDPNAIPTLSEWGMILLSVLLGIVAVRTIRKNRMAV